ncbi:MAG: hypothetical protein KME25_34530 [Symplocastrum torsivum CPER-KK1]|uniref:Uncharacterized protein n=1 Tax=Symplocastrum torsivum CPER-KK1 TaxID=450513 RepID=A0A951PV02_9CYAN|nr:hypothetical protein [Symplocastrum torsivum CPER-KK1]
MCITVTKDTDIPKTKGLSIVGSLWHVPLPLGSSKNSRVVVYFYNDRWFPITFYTLADAIALHHQAVREGRELVVFPPGLDPRTFEESYPTSDPIEDVSLSKKVFRKYTLLLLVLCLLS